MAWAWNAKRLILNYSFQQLNRKVEDLFEHVLWPLEWCSYSADKSNNVTQLLWKMFASNVVKPRHIRLTFSFKSLLHSVSCRAFLNGAMFFVFVNVCFLTRNQIIGKETKHLNFGNISVFKCGTKRTYSQGFLGAGRHKDLISNNSASLQNVYEGFLPCEKDVQACRMIIDLR